MFYWFYLYIFIAFLVAVFLLLFISFLNSFMYPNGFCLQIFQLSFLFLFVLNIFSF